MKKTILSTITASLLFLSTPSYSYENPYDTSVIINHNMFELALKRNINFLCYENSRLENKVNAIREFLDDNEMSEATKKRVSPEFVNTVIKENPKILESYIFETEKDIFKNNVKISDFIVELNDYFDNNELTDSPC